ncbi:MAG: glycosyltransferase [Methylococcaceae bacterium]
MKVLHVIPGVAKRYGGPSTAIFPMTIALQMLGVELVIVTTNADGPNQRLQINDLPDSVPIRLFPRDFSETWKVSWRMWQWLNSHVDNFDIVHIHAVWSFSTAVAARACIRHGVPYIIRPAGMLSNYSWQHKGWKKRLYWQLIEKKTITRAIAFHVTSQEERKDVQKFCPEADIFVIPNGVEEVAFTYPVKTRSSSWKELSVDSKQSLILFLSRLHPKKGITDRLLPAFALMKTAVRLVIVGDEDSHYPGYKTEILQVLRRLNLEDRVSLIENVTGNSRWGFFDIADVFVLPSHSENFGIVVAEAMARGCPVVVTREVQSSPLVEECKAGEVIEGGQEALSTVLENIISNPSLAEEMGQAGKAFVEKRLRWSSLAEDIKNMYEDCLS